MGNVTDIHGPGQRRLAGPAERKKLAVIFDAVGGAANATFRETFRGMPDISDQATRPQIANLGELVMYADPLRRGVGQPAPDSLEAILQLGRELSARVEVKP
jgi:hypothetical protein